MAVAAVGVVRECKARRVVVRKGRDGRRGGTHTSFLWAAATSSSLAPGPTPSTSYGSGKNGRSLNSRAPSPSTIFFSFRMSTLHPELGQNNDPARAAFVSCFS